MNSRSYTMTLSLFFLLFIITLCVTPLIGSSKISLARAFSDTINISNNTDAIILFQVRFPRILLGALTGAALSVAGAIFQALLSLEFTCFPARVFDGSPICIFRFTRCHYPGFQPSQDPARRIPYRRTSPGRSNRQFFLRGNGDVYPLPCGLQPVV